MFDSFMGQIAFYSAHIHFILLLVLPILARRDIAGAFRKVSGRTWLTLALIMVLATALRLDSFMLNPDMRYWNNGLSAKDMLVNKEYRYCLVGTVEDCHLSSYPTDKDIGYSYFIYLVFIISGISPYVLAYVSFFFGLLIVPFTFFATYLLLRKDSIALFTALITAGLPLLIASSGDGKIQAISLFFMTAAVTSFLIMLQRTNIRTIGLTLVFMVFLVKILPENILLIVPLVFWLAATKKTSSLLSTARQHWKVLASLFTVIGGYLCILSFSIIGNYVAASEHGSVSGTPFFLHPSHLASGISNFISYWHMTLPLIFVLFLAVSSASYKKDRHQIMFLVLWFLSFSVVYIFYFVPFHEEYGRQVILPLIALIALGLHNTVRIATGLIHNRLQIDKKLAHRVMEMVAALLILIILVAPSQDNSCKEGGYICGELGVIQQVDALFNDTAVFIVPRGEERDLWALAVDNFVLSLEMPLGMDIEDFITNETYFVMTPNFQYHQHLAPTLSELREGYNFSAVVGVEELTIHRLGRKQS